MATKHKLTVEENGWGYDVHWRWACSCGARGRWQWQSPDASRFLWERHAERMEGK